jgi:hypothetical protein
MHDTQWLNLSQAARTAGVTRQQMLDAIRRFELPAKLIESHWWIRSGTLDLWRQKRRRRATR